MTDERLPPATWDAEAPPPSKLQPPVRRRRSSARKRERAARKRRIVLAAIGAGVLLFVLAGVVLAVVRYLPALDEARALRADVEGIAGRIQAAGISIDREQLEQIETDLEGARERLEELAALLRDDPLVGVARGLPPTSSDVNGADAIVAAAGHLFDAAEDGLAMGSRFVEIKERQAADPAEASALALIVETMATSREHAVSASRSLERARTAVASVPEGLVGPIESARAAMAARLDTYGPLLAAYVDVSEDLPDILGWSEPRRYLVLTQNPAELRPTGGYIGSFGLVTFDRGRITERNFQDVFLLDLPWDFPFIEPPQHLADYLLGPDQPWQLADANWSPDFPTSAQDALRLYTNESGDTNVDGVLAITTYTVDELLRITGPVTIPDYDVTIAPGETTLKVLERTRVAPEPGTNRKAILSALADQLIPALLAVPTDRWAELVGELEKFSSQRLLLAWFSNPAHQELVAAHGFDGRLRDGEGDYLYAVDSNVAPTSKLHYVTTRSLDLDVQIDEVGNARSSLQVTWENRFETPDGDPIRDLQYVGGPNLGVFFRLLVPERSRVESVSGGSVVELTNPAAVEDAAGRTMIGNYLVVPPGSTSLRYTWVSPYAAAADQTGGTYTLTVQKQPGLIPGPLSIAITVPPGFTITQATDGVSVSGRTAAFETIFDRDVVLELRYGS